MNLRIAILAPAFAMALPLWAQDPLQIGSRRELFVDDHLISELKGQAMQRLHHPQPQEIAIIHDAPWEGSGSGYHSVFKDGDLYRMYYKAWQLEVKDGKIDASTHPLYTCYAESDDGIHWRKPEVGLHEFNGSKANNIVIPHGMMGKVKPDGGHPAVFKDDNPAAPVDAKYKAIVRSHKPTGLLALKSADGLRWSPMADAPVITDGAFDSQNLAFWDGESGVYRAYWRYFSADEKEAKKGPYHGIRSIRTATSTDFITWENDENLSYENSPEEQLYTNQIKPYHRAPHLLIGFPTRYIERDWNSASMKALPERQHREARATGSQRYGSAITEGLLMVSRNGVKFKRWNEAFLRPGIERDGSWNYGHQYIAWHAVETQSTIEGAPDELSFYATESYWTGNSSALRRYTLRLDGFISIHAPMKGGELITHPLTFTGKGLTLNFASSAAGDIQVEIQDATGKPVPGFTLADSEPQFGDSHARVVTWKGGSDVSALSGKPIRLRFVLRDADLFSLKFE
jgi:hypothetical protein